MSADSDDESTPRACARMYPYSTNPVWSDIVPVPQDDGPSPVIVIDYSPEFVETMNYFRAVLLKDERSERALVLTEHTIDLNSANYTAWYFRRLCLLELKKDLLEELKWCENIAQKSPKNYQLWHHRRALVEVIGHPGIELEHAADVLRGDAKNYHVWSHRQWVLRRFNQGWEAELTYVDELLQQDLRNNSAWNQRHFVIEHASAPAVGFTEQKIESELGYAEKYILKAVHNESPWNYVRGLTNKPQFTQWQTVERLCRTVLEASPQCVHALGLLVHVLTRNPAVESKQAAPGPAAAAGGATAAADPSSGARAEAIELCERLASSADTIRAKYWTYQRDLLKQA